MKVAIITEGFQGTGYGHLTRCLSIYQAFEEKNITPLYIANCDEEGKNFIPNTNLLQLNWIESVDEFLSKIKGYDIAVIDSYLAPLEIYEKIYRTVKKAVYIDDYLRLNYPPGVIVNGTVGAENLPYKKDDEHDYLLGIKYIPLRKEFWDIKAQKRDKQKTLNVLITFGGQDIENLTSEVLFHLHKKYPNFNYLVIVNSNFKPQIYGNNIFYYSLLDAKEMLCLMIKADIAITAAGQTTYELARVGVPTIAVGTADNQKNNILGWMENNFITKEIWCDDKDMLKQIDSQITTIIKNVNEQLVDGQGARRIVANVS